MEEETAQEESTEREREQRAKVQTLLGLLAHWLETHRHYFAFPSGGKRRRRKLIEFSHSLYKSYAMLTQS